MCIRDSFITSPPPRPFSLGCLPALLERTQVDPAITGESSTISPGRSEKSELGLENRLCEQKDGVVKPPSNERRSRYARKEQNRQRQEKRKGKDEKQTRRQPGSGQIAGARTARRDPGNPERTDGQPERTGEGARRRAEPGQLPRQSPQGLQGHHAGQDRAAAWSCGALLPVSY